MIYKELNKSMFMDEFRKSETYKDNFTYEGLSALYDYLEELTESTGEDLELDIVAICCDYSEYDIDELRQQYETLAEDLEDTDFIFALEDRTTVLEVGEDTYIIQDF